MIDAVLLYIIIGVMKVSQNIEWSKNQNWMDDNSSLLKVKKITEYFAHRVC